MYLISITVKLCRTNLASESLAVIQTCGENFLVRFCYMPTFTVFNKEKCAVILYGLGEVIDQWISISSFMTPPTNIPTFFVFHFWYGPTRFLKTSFIQTDQYWYMPSMPNSDMTPMYHSVLKTPQQIGHGKSIKVWWVHKRTGAFTLSKWCLGS